MMIWEAQSREVRSGDVTYRMRFDMCVWRLYESAGTPLAIMGSDIKSVRTLLWAMLAQEQPSLTLQSVGRLPLALAKQLVSVAVEVLAESLPSGHDADTTDDKQQPTLIDWYDYVAHAEFDLHIPEERFWRMSPRYLHALIVRWEDAVERHYLSAGIVAAQFVNANLKPDALPVSPLVFSPTKVGERARKELEPGSKQSRARVIEKARRLKEMMGNARTR